MMKAGFIGYRNFAGKLKTLFEQSGYVKEILYFHPKKKILGLLSTNRLQDLFNSDFIVIASPDWTHGEYLRNLENYKGYIFCEKVPVIKHSDLRFLKNNINPKLYFNFNLRKSYLCEVLKEHSNRILYLNCLCGHGFALRKIYRYNWRSSASCAPLGVFEMSGVHFFDLLIFCFGRPKSYYFVARNISPYGNSIDNFNICLEFQNKITANLFFSYTSPYRFNLETITRDCLITVTEHNLIIRGPRETFDKKTGLFTQPPILYKKKIDLYEGSLKNSVDYFLNIVRSKARFKRVGLKKDFLSTELFLDILDEAKGRGYLK